MLSEPTVMRRSSEALPHARNRQEDVLTDAVAETATALSQGLVEYLAEVTQAAESDPELDILSVRDPENWDLRWLEELPPELGYALDGEIISMAPPERRLQPQPPGEVRAWLEDTGPWSHRGPEPRLGVPSLAEATDEDGQPPVPDPPPNVVRLFDHWLDDWRTWAEERKSGERLQLVYDFLEKAAKALEQRDDEVELVLSRGLVMWIGDDGRPIRRHLVVEPVVALLVRDNAVVTVSSANARRRLEDRQVLGHLLAYDTERAAEFKRSVDEAGTTADSQDYLRVIGPALDRLLNTEVHEAEPLSHRSPPSAILRIADAPALILRPRSRTALAEAYKEIGQELRACSDEVPVAFAQLVVDTEPAQRQAWVTTQGGAPGDLLGDDPRFPLPANPEQERVMELLRTETSVVVQGPPGTGKTHTIANLMSALLARGQRVLVTSQKDQALRVLRDKIPPELRTLCVLLAGGSRDAAKELQQSLEALSDAISTNDESALRRRVEHLSNERIAVRGRAEVLNRRIRDLREVEFRRHPPVVPWFTTERYLGTLGDIVREVKSDESKFDWFPQPVDQTLTGHPPLTNREMLELRSLLLGDSAARRARTGQMIPSLTHVPPSAAVVVLLDEVRQAAAHASSVETPASRQLSDLPRDVLVRLADLRRHAVELLAMVQYDEKGIPRTAPEWTVRAMRDLLTGRSAGLWGTVLEVRGEAARLQRQLNAQGNAYVVELQSVTTGDLGRARGVLDAGQGLLEHLRNGGTIKKRFPGAAQKRAEPLLARVRVNGTTPSTVGALAAALDRLEAEIATLQLVEKWADCGVAVGTDRPHATRSELADMDAHLSAVQHFVALHGEVLRLLAQLGLGPLLRSPEQLMSILSHVPAALSRAEHDQSVARYNVLRQQVQDLASRPDACPELTALVAALRDEDPAAYERARDSLVVAAEEKVEAQRLAALSSRLQQAHPTLYGRLASTAADDDWVERSAALDVAWAWSEAQRFVVRSRTAEEERRLNDEYGQLEDHLSHVTAKLAAAEATLKCLGRMTDTHAAALRSYREHMKNVGGGGGRNTRKFQTAAKAAMEKAKGAVPAWVVPLSTLLDNIPLERNSFDVVIIDEASQVGMEQLYLLWLAPRIIVVGDDKQCTPGENRLGSHDLLHAGIERHLRDADQDIRQNFTAKTNLYGLLSARSGKDSVIRLREHFRCVPEIIAWSSTQFYGQKGLPGLIPLRERSARDLKPLVVTYLEDGYTEGRNSSIRNPIEAKRIADQLAACVEDPRYADKTFGVIVLQGGQRQVRLLDHEIAVRLSPEIRTERKIRVGIPSDFQGDERNVVFLSLVVAPRPDGKLQRLQRMLSYQQSYNVAASRAEDQLWLFTSISRGDLNPEDLRASLLDYMSEPPPTYGPSPELSEVSEDVRTPPFESLLEQRVFREIRGRGYHVVPQYEVGTRSLDLVVVGDGARVAIECDGHLFHTGADQVTSDARRDRELARMKWEVLRIRESEFEFDRARELGRLWPVLADRGISPQTASGTARPGDDGTWAPLTLSDDDIDEPDDGS
jgi:very-short-patch-repair endonuclease